MEKSGKQKTLSGHEHHHAVPLWAHPVLESVFAILGGVSFFLLCIAFPLVGPAGSRVPNAAQNRATFLAVLLLSLLLNASACYVGFRRRKEPVGFSQRLPTAPLILCALCLFILGALSTGALGI